MKSQAPTGTPTPGPGSRMPHVLRRAELKAEPKRGSVLSSVWEHLPSSSGTGPSLPERGLGTSQQQLRPKRWAAQEWSVHGHRLSLPSVLTLAPSPQTEQMTWSWTTASPHAGLSVPKYPPILGRHRLLALGWAPRVAAGHGQQPEAVGHWGWEWRSGMVLGRGCSITPPEQVCNLAVNLRSPHLPLCSPPS